MSIATLAADEAPRVTAPDGSAVRVLLSLARGSMAEFALAPGTVARAVAHRTVEELWYVVAGTGRMWRRLGAAEATVALAPGVCLSLPVGTHFQFRCDGAETLRIVGATMPPWPGEQEAYRVEGPWEPTA